MRSPCNIKEVQQLTGRLAALSREKENFEWTQKCEEAFCKIKVFLTTPSVLHRPARGRPSPCTFQFQKMPWAQYWPKILKKERSPSTLLAKSSRDQKIERLALAVVTTARKLCPYFQSHKIIIYTNYPIKQVLGKPDLAGRMVAWSVELSEYDIQFARRNNIKSQVLADFVVEFTLPIQSPTLKVLKNKV